MIVIGSFGAEINPKGAKLEPDEDGYYFINLGALNVENTSGVFYEGPPDIISLFQDSTSGAAKKVKEKRLYGEYKHPDLSQFKGNNPQTGKPKWIYRQLRIDSDRHAVHIKNFKLLETDEVDRITGRRKILIKGNIKPYGPFKDVLEDSLENPHIDTCFSLRALAMERKENGRRIRRIFSVVTWDFVPAPGIPGSSDQHTSNVRPVGEEDLEMLENMTLLDSIANEDRDDINEAISAIRKECELKQDQRVGFSSIM